MEIKGNDSVEPPHSSYAKKFQDPAQWFTKQ